MAKRETFLLRLDPQTMDALRVWASDELRSVNGQIEYLLRRALIAAGRGAPPAVDRGEAPGTSGTMSPQRKGEGEG